MFTIVKAYFQVTFSILLLCTISRKNKAVSLKTQPDFIQLNNSPNLFYNLYLSTSPS